MLDRWANYIIALLSLSIALMAWFRIRPRDVAGATRDVGRAMREAQQLITLDISAMALYLMAVAIWYCIMIAETKDTHKAHTGTFSR